MMQDVQVTKSLIIYKPKVSHRFCISHQQAVEARTSLHIHADIPEFSVLAHTK